MVFVAKCITCTYILETDTGSNISTTNFFHWILFVRVHLEQTRDTLLLVRACIQNIRPRYYLSRIYAEIAQTTHIRIRGNLKCQCCQGLFRKRFTLNYDLWIARIMSCHCRCIRRARQVCTNSVKQSLHTFILKRRPTYHGVYLHWQCPLTNSSTNFIFGNLRRIIEIFLHHRIIEFRNGFQHLVTPFLRLGL